MTAPLTREERAECVAVLERMIASGLVERTAERGLRLTPAGETRAHRMIEYGFGVGASA